MTIDPVAEKLVADLRDRGVKLWIDGGLLRFSASKTALTPPLLAKMRKHKTAILELLEFESPTDDDLQKSSPLSLGQEALWLLHKQYPESHAYNTAATMRFVSDVDVAALENSFRKLVARHEPLRTTFSASKDGVEAVIHSSEMLDFSRTCVADVPDENALLRKVRTEYERPFDLHNGPLMRVHMFSRSETDHILLIAVHHIVFDAWSLWLMQDELQALYASEVKQSDCLLPTLASTFSDFVRWQREFPNTDAGEEQWKYWKSQLTGDPVPAELLWDHKRPRHNAPRGETFHFPIDATLTNGLRDLARSAGATPFATGLAVFQTLVFRHTQVVDSVIGITTSGRSRSEFSKAIGYFVNTLPIRSKITSDMSFGDVLNDTKQTTIEAIQAQDFPFAELVHRLKPVRDPSAPPLCRMVFGLQKPTSSADVASLLTGDGDAIDWAGTQVKPYKMDQQEGQFDLVLELYDTPDRFAGVLKYDANLMSEQSATRFANRFVHLLSQVVDDPTRPIGEYSIVPAEEKNALNQWMTGPVVEKLKHARYDRWFEEQVDANLESEAIVVDDQRLTFSQLDVHANRVARLLLEHGASSGKPVMVASRRCIESPALMLACFKIGATYVPVSPSIPKARAISVIEDCRPSIIIAEDALATELTDEIDIPVLDRTSLLQNSKDLDGTRLLSAFSGSAVAYIIYTSGSTGVPKGIAVSHSAICQHVASMGQVYETTNTDKLYQFSDLTFDPSIEQMLVPWSVGAAVIMRGDLLPAVDSFWQRLREENVTIVNLPPKYFQECSRSLPIGEAFPDCLRLMIVGGDVFPQETISAWSEKKVRLINAYGPTEAIITATTTDIDSRHTSERVPIGKPKPGSTAFVVDSEGNLCAIGVVGELCLGGPMLASGYVNLPEATGKQFCELTIDGKQTRVYRTGDLARWNTSGDLEFLGRIDRQVKVRGFRIELGEIESVLSSHDSIESSIVKAFEHDGQTYLAAFVVASGPEITDSGKLTSHLKGRLPIYMVPSRIIILDQFPLLPSGKIDSNQLTAEAPSMAAVRREFVAPRNEIEQIMADVWSKVLGIDRVGIMDDFYELGGGSLQSLRIVSEMTENGLLMEGSSGDKQLEPQMLFQYTTISELSPHLELSSK